ncbi:MAG: ABC transporter permease [Cyclobacteriaceae bacterium]|jgi:ABC-type antimicrobial peptide transport system permease subunit|nr:ABC transporter permease [Cyclobacteriaceae bacterium]
MLRNYLLITLRSLLKNKLFIFINVFGMGMAIACCLVAYLNYQFARGWDTSQKNAERIYRVQFWREFQEKRERYGMAPMPLAQYIRQNIKGVSRVVRLQPSYTDIRIGEEVFGTQTAFADSAFFDLFTVDLRHGTFSNFHDKSKIFISDKIALKYFNRTDVLDESLTQIVLGKDGIRRPKEFIIGGVYKELPLNTSVRFDAITLFDNFWDINLDPEVSETNWKRWVGVLFLEINNPADVASVTQQLQAYVEPQNKVREDFKISSYYLENYVGMMQRNRANPRVDNDWLGGGIPDEAVTVPVVMAVLLLLLACFNFTNTSIAISSRRLKEIGIRKVMGGMRAQLMLQFFSENLFLCLLGLLAGLLLAEWMVPAYDSLWPWLELRLDYSENATFLIFLIALLLITAIIAGGYPSVYVTSFEPVSILKGTARFGGTNWFTRSLLFGQFIISILCVVFSIGFYRNGHYQREYDLGFDRHGIIAAWVNNEGGYNTYRDALAGNPDIELIAATRHHVANSWYNDPIKVAAVEREVDIMEIGENYFEAVDMTLLAGRHFQRDSETDKRESVLVTEEFVKEFQWGSAEGAIGKRIVWMDTVSLYVVGVVKNIYARALWEPIQPLMIRMATPANYQQLVVRAKPENLKRVDEFMEKKWKEVFPNAQYTGEMIEEDMAEADQINKNVVIMFSFLGAFAALMTGIGLYTLVSLNIVRKMKEIGVRKVLGASLGNIAAVINREFVINLSLATLLGGVLGLLAVNWLMDSIWEYYLKVGFVTLALAGALMFLLGVVTVGFKTVKTAMFNPTQTLRSE